MTNLLKLMLDWAGKVTKPVLALMGKVTKRTQGTKDIEKAVAAPPVPVIPSIPSEPLAPNSVFTESEWKLRIEPWMSRRAQQGYRTIGRAIRKARGEE